MQTRYFAAVGDKKKQLSGWPMSFVSGNSISDNKDWSIETIGMKADEIPEECTDSKTFSELVAGLLNCYYNSLETKGKTPEEIMRCGRSLEELGIPDPENPTLF